MKVLMVSGGRGGVYRFTYEIVNRLFRKGYNFFVIFVTGNKDLMSPPLKNIPFIFINDLKEWGNIKKIFKIKKFDIIHSNFAAPIPFLMVARKPIVFTCHGLPQPLLEIGFKEKLLFSIEKLIFPLSVKKATAVVSVSNFIQNQIESVYNTSSQVIYHGIDSAIHSHITCDKSECKKRLHIDPKEKIILYVGKLHPYKDPLTLLNSFGMVARKLSKTRLVLVGEGKLRHKILKLAKNLQISDKVSIYSHLNFDELALFHRAADVFVLPSINEAFGIVILEAMASGTPPIVSNSGAGPEIIQNCGLIFEQGNHRDLAEKILQLLENKNLAQTLASNGYERVKKVFSWERSVAQYEKLYSHLIK